MVLIDYNIFGPLNETSNWVFVFLEYDKNSVAVIFVIPRITYQFGATN